MTPGQLVLRIFLCILSFILLYKIVKGIKNRCRLAYRVNQDRRTCTVIGMGKARTLDVVIPAKIRGRRVSAVGAYAFYGCNDLASVTISPSVSCIESFAFAECRNLTEVKLPVSLTHIQRSAFAGCDSLKSIVIPNNVDTLDSSVFSDCSELRNVTIGDGVKRIEDSAFRNCDNLTSIVIPDNVTHIESNAFYACGKLMHVTLGKHIKSISDSAFIYCKKLVEVYNLSSLKIIAGEPQYGGIGYYAKAVHTSTQTPSKLKIREDGLVLYEDGEEVSLVGYIGNKAELVLPDTFNNKPYSINQSAFRKCQSLKSITVPNTVKSIGLSAFSHCNKLESLTLPFVGDGQPESKNNYFGYVFGAKSYTDNFKALPASLKTVTITGGKSIENSAFENCRGLMNITIGGGVKQIGEFAFSYCKDLTNLTLENGVENIGYFAFYNCSRLKSISIPDSVKLISSRAFLGCTNLRSVSISDSVTNIGNYAFGNGKKLTSVVIGSGVKGIGHNVFNGCPAITQVYYHGTENGWKDISICNDNFHLVTPPRFDYSETRPAGEGNYWHYVDGVPTAW